MRGCLRCVLLCPSGKFGSLKVSAAAISEKFIKASLASHGRHMR
jgi:hypothetical protein